VKFVDEVQITVSSGQGGQGSVSFRRESMDPRGGPDGGDGGKGANLVFRATPQLNTLIDYRFKKKFHAPRGGSGGARNMSGADGADLILRVPPGTLVRDTATGEILLDMTTEGDYIFLAGGRGGKGNWFFRTSVNQAPDRAQPGEEGETKEVTLELKLIADVGVIGYPNAGKSTLISAISAAKPKIADYPFTTLVPNLGVVRANEEQSFVMADIPGLVPGAHKGVGLGTQFLRHIERTNLFVHLIDASGAAGRDPYQDYLDITNELVEYDRSKEGDSEYVPLATRTQLVVLNKIDAIDEEETLHLQAKFLKAGIETMAISAAARKGLRELVIEIGKRVLK
jgi:GTP-binding protein